MLLRVASSGLAYLKSRDVTARLVDNAHKAQCAARNTSPKNNENSVTLDNDENRRTDTGKNVAHMQVDAAKQRTPARLFPRLSQLQCPLLFSDNNPANDCIILATITLLSVHLAVLVDLQFTIEIKTARRVHPPPSTPNHPGRPQPRTSYVGSNEKTKRGRGFVNWREKFRFK